MAANADIATGLARIGMVLRAESWRQAEATGLSPTQAQILSYLVQRGPARVGAVAEAIAVTQPTASDAVAALARKGHVERRPDPQDARAVLLHTTVAGRRLANALAVWPDALLGAIDALDPAEEAVFVKGLVKMIRALQVRGAIPVQRLCVSCRHFRPHVHSDAARPHHCAFVDAAFGNAALRLDCGEHVAADAAVQLENWVRFKEAAA
ncbi:MAG: MarR family transcriptional regulator [Alphaproteobacteria bacterium 65-7]|nr:MAG: MarR family transcriptional regulator [Alphaproteobacteria bacterium 65-7]